MNKYCPKCHGLLQVWIDPHWEWCSTCLNSVKESPSINVNDLEEIPYTPLNTSKGCDHGVSFDIKEAELLLGNWQARSLEDFVRGNPKASEIKKRWPRLNGPCPKGCGFTGIYYASYDHYIMGDW